MKNGNQKRVVGYVYIMQAIIEGKSLIKIGHTVAHPRRRLSQINMASPIPVRLKMFAKIEGGKNCYKFFEKHLHDKYKHQVHHGEWFEAELPDYNILMTTATWPSKNSFILAYSTTEVWVVGNNEKLIWSRSVEEAAKIISEQYKLNTTTK